MRIGLSGLLALLLTGCGGLVSSSLAGELLPVLWLPGGLLLTAGLWQWSRRAGRIEVKRVQTRLQSLEMLLDESPAVIFEMERNVAGAIIIRYVSRGARQLFAIEIDSAPLSLEVFLRAIHPEDQPRVVAIIQQSASLHQAVELEYRVLSPQGPRWVKSMIRLSGGGAAMVWSGVTVEIDAQKRAETLAEQAEQRLRELTDGVPGFIWQMRQDSCDTPRHLSFVSAGVSSHGLTPAEAVADVGRLYAHVHAQDRECLAAAIEHSFANRSPLRVDYRLQLPSGLPAWMRIQAAPVQQPEGGVVWNGMAFNISEEKFREAQARRAEERLSSIANALPGVVFQLATAPAAEPVYTYVSEGARTIFQLEPEAILRDAKPLHEMVLSEDYQHFRIALSESTPQHDTVLREYRIRHGDGALRWLRTLIRPQGKDGDLFIWNGFTQDITDEKEAQLRATTLQLHLHEVTENVPCTVFQIQRGVSGKLAIRFVSENIYGLIGITREDLMQDIRVLGSRVVAEDLPLMLNALDTADHEQRPVVVDIRIRDTADNLRWLRGSVSTPSQEADCLVWNGAWLDITDIKTLEAELARASHIAESANRLKSEFLATMSHEIRTPMNAIIGLGQLIQQTQLTAHQRGYLDKINVASQSLLAILNDILDHSKIEAGKMRLERREFDLNSVLDSLSAVTHLKAAEKDLELRFEVPPGLPMRLLGDSLRLGQVLLNLTSNAIKFSEQGAVVVRVREVSRGRRRLRLAFEISDQGIGLAREQIQRLFHSFAQGDASTTRQYGGTGLGLSISRNLVHLMGGEISVESVPGQGSVFRFDANLGLSQQPQPRYELPEELLGEWALVVDDNAETRRLTERWLVAFGLRVMVAESGLAALQCLQQQPAVQAAFALVVLDWSMPVLSGVETAERIRKLPLTTQPALLMAVAYVNDERARQAEAVGVQDFLAKPFSPAGLFNAVLATLGRAESGAANQPPSLAGLRVLLAGDDTIDLESTGEMTATDASTTLAESMVGLFDRAALLRRLGGKQDLLDRQLQRFAVDHADAAKQVALAVEKGDIAHAIDAAHKLRGMAAKLCAGALADSAAAVESALQKDGLVSDLALDLLCAHQQQTLHAMQTNHTPPALERASSGQSREQLKHAVGRLQQLILAHDADAKDAYETLQQQLPEISLPSLLRLRSAVENYQFESAAKALQELSIHLNLAEGALGATDADS